MTSAKVGTVAQEDDRSVNPNPQAPVFATTHWSVVAGASGVFDEQAAVALERLCETYWSPLYA